MLSYLRRFLTLFLVLLAAVPAWSSAQQQPQNAEIIRGIVRNTDNEPVAGARVTVTGLESYIRRTAETNAKGQYTILFGDPESEYVVAVAAIGYSKMTGRAKRGGNSKFLIVDVVLPRRPVVLDSMTVTSKGPADKDGGGNERDVRNTKLFSLDPSAVSSLMAQIPGAARMPGMPGGPDRYSVLGASADQNSVLLDGSRYDGRSIPPDMLESATATTSTYDASRGNFAGGQVMMRTRAGRDQFAGNLAASLSHPSLAWADPRAADPIPQNLNWNGNLSGPIKAGRLNYNFGFSQQAATRDFVSLLSLNQLQREQNGLSVDSIFALQQTLAQLGIPVVTSRTPEQSTTRSRSALLRVDAMLSSTTALMLSVGADGQRELGSGVSALGFPSLGGGSESRNFRSQLSGTTYLGGFVAQYSATYQRGANSTGPFVPLPNGNVRLGALYPGGTEGIANLAFGGGTSGQADMRTRSWSLQNEISRFSSDNRHRLSFGQSLDLNSSWSRNVSQPFGAFAYQSLADLAANRPASFTRSLSTVERSTRNSLTAFWLQAESQLTPDRFTLNYGVRFDLNHAASRPQYNPLVDTLFGRRTDQVPSAMAFSPRLGFTWIVPPRSERDQLSAYGVGGFGRLTVQGSVGAFRGFVPNDRIAGLIDATGLPNAVRNLNCVGAATPIPDWTNLAANPAAPMQCLDGAGAIEFATDVPGVQLFHPGYRPPTSWRGDLNISGFGFAGWSLSVGGQYSKTLNGESAIDMNLRRSPAFALASEGGRPMYVTPSGIVPATGAVAPGASRLSERFGTVTEYLSDLDSRAWQFTLGAQQMKPLFGKLPLMLNYTYNDVRQQERGFGGNTAGDPLEREWARGAQSRHQISINTMFPIPFASLTVQTTITSGTPYTPMVMGDVNGDGQANDRAFIADPATTGDPVLAEQMSALLASATPSTRACLQRQLGQIAGRNSCSTGWRVQPDVRFDLRLPGLSDPNGNRSALGERLQLTVTTQNLVGTLMHLARVPSTSLNLLSGATYPLDRNLLYVDGFDPETQRFRYRVNQQFGEGRPQRFRNQRSYYTGAFQVQLGAQLRLGAFERHRPMVEHLGLVSPDRKLPPPTEAEMRERLRGTIQDPYVQLLTLRDSLLLTEEQVKWMETKQVAFLARADSSMTPIVDYVVERGYKAKDKKVMKLVGKIQLEMWPLMHEELVDAVAQLREEQKARLPQMVQWMLKNDWGKSKNAKGKDKKKKEQGKDERDNVKEETKAANASDDVKPEAKAATASDDVKNGK